MMYMLIIIASLTSVIFLLKGTKPNQSLKQKHVTQVQKPIIMLMVDSLMQEPMQQAIKEGKAQAIDHLMRHGHLYPDVISSYPTMSVTIDSSLLTGTYSDKHRVPGLVWFNEKEKKHVNYGSAREEVLKTGLKNVAEDSLYHLNHTHLSRDVKTLHEEVEDTGLQSASVNALVYRGNKKTKLANLNVLKKADIIHEHLEIETPALFSYGAMAQYSPHNRNNTRLWQGIGFNDRFSAQELIYFIKENKLPAFTLAYFPDLDKEVHKKGPKNHIKAIEKTDKELQDVLDAFGSWEKALESAIWIVMGDSGQAKVGKEKSESMIKINDLLDRYNIHKISDPLKEEHQIVIAHNERMAFVYRVDDELDLKDIAQKLKKDERIGFVAWKEGPLVHVAAGGHKEMLAFSPGGDYIDTYGQTWLLSGDHSVLDLSKNSHRIEYGKYPDALTRLHSALNSHSGSYLIADAKPGYEFQGEGTPIHPGGAAHGSMHEQDSLVPMVVAGTDSRPKNMRIVDIKAWILELITQEE
ncbi:MAG TPA: alkaline phosphatase family protein [Bacillaceae bacterium]